MAELENDPRVARAVLGGGMIWIDAGSERSATSASGESKSRLRHSHARRRSFGLASLLSRCLPLFRLGIASRITRSG